ncbi:hypothetical protein [Oceanicaulis sp. MMSF_3324]|uniref:hypothetical protein n=1 Tax=Oceanicaulis sp. MMSF_3324 TaxID=3046702 RepID=UPI00273DE6E9|nr:hypothetical protein [Oceanicaulis sp. MMSF_3324]
MSDAINPQQMLVASTDENAVSRLHLLDEGQDLLWFDVMPAGEHFVIHACGYGFNRLYQGRLVHGESAKAGEKADLYCLKDDRALGCIKWPIVRIELRDPAKESAN